MRWRDYSTVHPDALALLPERFRLVALWTKHIPLEYVLPMTYDQMRNSVSEPLFKAHPDDGIHVLRDHNGTPCGIMPIKLFDDTRDYGIRLRKREIFGDRDQVGKFYYDELVFRDETGSVSRNDFLEELIDALSRAFEERERLNALPNGHRADDHGRASGSTAP